jgi:hypothetical protein
MPKAIKCNHCNEYVGFYPNEEELDEYELMRSHLNSCDSKIAKMIRRGF